MKVFVTGGAGFIGSHLIDRLISEGHELTAYDNLSSGKREFIAHHLGQGGFEFIEADTLNFDKLVQSMKGFDIVFHLAANGDIRQGIVETDLHLKQGTITTYNVLESMKINRIKKIVFSSSATVYGETPVMPLPEDYGPLLPISLYGASKLAAEGLISAFCGTFGMQGWIFRFANIVGKKMGHGVIYDFIEKLNRNPHELEILGDGHQRKPFVHIEDCINAILYGCNNSNGQINVLNIGCSSSTDITTIAKMVVEEVGLKDVRFKYTGGNRGWPGDVPQLRFNVEKMKKLGWEAKYTSDEAGRKAIREMLGKE
jgi:UDP-glucose 4-epimerase